MKKNNKNKSEILTQLHFISIATYCNYIMDVEKKKKLVDSFIYKVA